MNDIKLCFQRDLVNNSSLYEMNTENANWEFYNYNLLYNLSVSAVTKYTIYNTNDGVF